MMPNTTSLSLIALYLHVVVAKCFAIEKIDGIKSRFNSTIKYESFCPPDKSSGGKIDPFSDQQNCISFPISYKIYEGQTANYPWMV